MAVRTAYVPVAGTAITAANHIKFPGGWIGYVEVTANQTGISSTADLTGLSVTVTAGTSRRLRVNGYAVLQQQTSNATATLTIRNGASTQLAAWQMNIASGAFATATPMRVETPSSGSNTFKLSLTTNAGTIDVNASSTTPACILVEDIGPSA